MKKPFNAKKVILTAIAVVLLLESVDQSVANASNLSCGCVPPPYDGSSGRSSGGTR